MKTYIITGGAGFIGSNLARRLINRGAVYLIDDLSTGFKKNIPKAAVFCKADVSDMSALLSLRLPDKVDCVYHLAAQSSGEASFDDPVKDIDLNYKATYNVLNLAALKRCKRFIFSSSMSVYGEVPVSHEAISEDFPCNPTSYYGCNKLASEKLIKVFSKNAGIEYTIFRIFTAYGPSQNMTNMRQGMASIYLAYLLHNSPILVKGSLERFRDFIYIDDILEAMTKGEDCKAAYGEVFNIGSSIKTPVKELLEIMLEVYGKDDFKKWVIVKGSTPGDIKGCVADISRLKKALGWKPKFGLQEGITKMKDFLDKEALNL